MREINIETRMEDALKVGQHTLESMRTAQIKLENVRKWEMRERFGGNVFISIIKNMKKRKSIVVMLLCIMVLCACGKKNVGLEDYSEFIGRWQCAEAGNPGIAGELQIISDKELQLDCNTEDDFDPPVTWEDMQETQVVTYELVEEKEIHVTFVAEEGNSTLAFYKVE